MTVVEDYQAQAASLAGGAGVQVAAIFGVVQAGAIAEGQAAAMIAAVINTANAGAAALADAYVSAAVESRTGVPAPAAGVVPVDDAERLEAAARTILEDLHGGIEAPDARGGGGRVGEGVSGASPDPVRRAEQRLVRLAEAEPLATTQRVAVDVMDAQPQVVGWRRRLDADPCELCRWWYAGGRVYRTVTAFQRHPNCQCQPEPVISERSATA